jgi:hypothetical protein
MMATAMARHAMCTMKDRMKVRMILRIRRMILRMRRMMMVMEVEVE